MTLNIKSYNEYIVKKVNDEVTKQVNEINRLILDKVNIQLQQALQVYSDGNSPQSKELINKLIVNAINSVNPDVANLVNSHVDMRIGMLTVTDGDPMANTGTILSKLTDEIANLVASDDTFNEYMSQLLTQYLQSNKTLTTALNNKINSLIDNITNNTNNTNNTNINLVNIVNARLDQELTKNVENYLLGIVTDMSKTIIPRFIDGIANIYVMMPGITMLENIANDLYGIPFALVTVVPVQNTINSVTSVTTRQKLSVPTISSNNGTINPEFITDMISENIASALNNQMANVVPHPDKYRELYRNMSIQISNKPVIYMGVNTNDNILMHHLVSINEPLDPMIKYVFMYDLLTTNTQAETIGEIARRFLIFVDNVNQIFSPTPAIVASAKSRTTNAVSQESLDTLITSLWNFMQYITLTNTKIVLNRNVVPDISISRPPRYSSDDETIDFLYTMINLYVNKIKLQLMQALMATAMTSDSIMSYELKRFKGSIAKLIS